MLKNLPNFNQTFLLEQMMPIIMTHLGGFLSFFEVQHYYSVCGSSSNGQEWVKNQHGARSDWGFTKSNTAV